MEDAAIVDIPQIQNQDISGAIEGAANTFKLQSHAISALAGKLDKNYQQALGLILNTSGRVIVSGMGKSGLIGKKIVATLASTGTPSFFMHPAEAYHGDLGMVTPNDVVILISYSGETDEVIRLIPSLKHFDVSVICMVGILDSTLAKHSDVVLDISVEREVCPNNLAPTTSTLTTLAMGDALAVSLIHARNFQPQDFARFHPGGSLGRRLLTMVKDVMHSKNLPIVSLSASVNDVVFQITRGRQGLAIVMEDHTLKGIITDGDLRRTLLGGINNLDQVAEDMMTRNPITIQQDTMLVEAEGIMKQHKIKALVVVDESEQVQGIVEIFDE